MRLKQQLNRTTADEVLTISFQHANLDDQMCEYVALSYAWGNAKPTTRIQVKSGRRIFFKLITTTLEAALRQLQLGHTSRLVWADALCINQEPDSEEKGMQVMQMDRIYNSAKSVHVWLGPSSVESDLAMKFIRRITRQVFWDLGPFRLERKLWSVMEGCSGADYKALVQPKMDSPGDSPRQKSYSHLWR